MNVFRYSLFNKYLFTAPGFASSFFLCLISVLHPRTRRWMSDATPVQANCHTRCWEECLWNNDAAESQVITSLNTLPGALLTLWQRPRVSIHCPEQNHRERLIYSRCQRVQREGSAWGRPRESACRTGTLTGCLYYNHTLIFCIWGDCRSVLSRSVFQSGGWRFSPGPSR